MAALFAATFSEDVQKMDLSFWLCKNGLPMLWAFVLFGWGVFLLRTASVDE
jgi:hypothetical protein